MQEVNMELRNGGIPEVGYDIIDWRMSRTIKACRHKICKYCGPVFYSSSKIASKSVSSSRPACIET